MNKNHEFLDNLQIYISRLCLMILTCRRTRLHDCNYKIKYEFKYKIKFVIMFSQLSMS